MHTAAVVAVSVGVLLLLYVGGQGLDRVGRRGYDYLATFPIARWFLRWRPR